VIRRGGAILALLAIVITATTVPGGPVRPTVAAEYTLETSATYDVRPDAGEISVTVEMTFTNTTPDTDTQISIFPEVLLGVHDDAADVAASDAEGALDVEVAVNDEDVNVATVQLRDDLRYEESVDLELTYVLADGDDPQLRVRPAVVVFPAWGFGTTSAVSVTVPTGYEVRIDGDPLTESDGRLMSGPQPGRPSTPPSVPPCRSPAGRPTSRFVPSPTTRPGANARSPWSSARCRSSRRRSGCRIRGSVGW
jgi:hypothetical protein